MSITQRYWKVRTPWLILTGVLFGPFGVSALHIPSYLAYYGHRKGWGGSKVRPIYHWCRIDFAVLGYVCI
jgi:hypothetical protein